MVVSNPMLRVDPQWYGVVVSVEDGVFRAELFVITATTGLLGDGPAQPAAPHE